MGSGLSAASAALPSPPLWRRVGEGGRKSRSAISDFDLARCNGAPSPRSLPLHVLRPLSRPSPTRAEGVHRNWRAEPYARIPYQPPAFLSRSGEESSPSLDPA